MYMIRHCKKQMMWVVIIAAVIMMMMAAALDKAPVCLGDLRPELVQSSCTAVELQWGGLSVKIDDSAQIEQIQQLAVDLKVKKTGKNRRNEIMYEDMAYQVPVMNGIHFFIDTEVVESISLSGDFTEIAPKDNDREDCAYLQVQEPEQLQALFLTQGQNLLAQQKDTAFTADLDNDGVPEQIVVNMNPWSENAATELSIYRSDGAVLDWQTFASAHAGWGSCYLYQQEGRDYILYYYPTMGQGYADYQWQLVQFDAAGEPIVVQENSMAFTINPEQYQFDVQKIYAYLQEIDGMLQDAILIISTINGDLQYSSVEKQICPTAESYMNQWFSSFLPEENQNLDLQQQLQLVQDELYFARPQELLEQWLQARIDFDRQRQQLVVPELCVIAERQCVSFSLCRRENGQVIGRYAISTQDTDDWKAVDRCYYQWQDGAWVLLDHGADGVQGNN